jgi:hypothetical protein
VISCVQPTPNAPRLTNQNCPQLFPFLESRLQTALHLAGVLQGVSGKKIKQNKPHEK